MIQIQTGNPVEYDGIKFDSTFESEVYKFLRHYFPKEDISVHRTLVLYKETEAMKALTFSIDFYVHSQDIWIEAKGDIHSVINGPFKVKCHILHRVFPSMLERLIVVTPRGKEKLHWGNATTASLHHLKKLFSSMGIDRLT